MSAQHDRPAITGVIALQVTDIEIAPGDSPDDNWGLCLSSADASMVVVVGLGPLAQMAHVLRDMADDAEGALREHTTDDADGDGGGEQS